MARAGRSSAIPLLLPLEEFWRFCSADPSFLTPNVTMEHMEPPALQLRPGQEQWCKDLLFQVPATLLSPSVLSRQAFFKPNQ